MHLEIVGTGARQLRSSRDVMQDLRYHCEKSITCGSQSPRYSLRVSFEVPQADNDMQPGCPGGQFEYNARAWLKANGGRAEMHTTFGFASVTSDNISDVVPIGMLSALYPCRPRSAKAASRLRHQHHPSPKCRELPDVTPDLPFEGFRKNAEVPLL
jgi:hypothetical protein